MHNIHPVLPVNWGLSFPYCWYSFVLSPRSLTFTPFYCQWRCSCSILYLIMECQCPAIIGISLGTLTVCLYGCRWAAMGPLQRQMARLCRRLKLHRILRSSSHRNNHLMHGRSLKESSSGECPFLSFDMADSPFHQIPSYRYNFRCKVVSKFI